jgi:predicted N-formylglutamate amidohydrolase
VYFGGYQHAKKDWEKRTAAIVVPFGKSVSQLVARLQEAQRQLIQVINGGRTV